MTLIFWSIMAAVMWYGRSEWLREKRARAVQNVNNHKMETIHED